MATKEQIAHIRNARAGKTSSQLILGKYYLFGGAGLARNPTSALYWLHRAALRHSEEAWRLIGEHIPFDTAVAAPDPEQLCAWYERASEVGIAHAGLVWVKLLLANPAYPAGQPLPRKAMAALEQAASTGVVEAQWLLAQQLKKAATARTPPGTPPLLQDALEWATRAAANGVRQAQRALAERAWEAGDADAFLQWSAPLVAALANDGAGRAGVRPALSEQDITLLSRHAQALFDARRHHAGEIERYWELAAQAGDRHARFALGLWYANMDEDGERLPWLARNGHYRKAIQWLTLAGEQGLAKAWYALYRIYMRPNTGLTEHSVADAERCLERAAERGHAAAQLELGKRCWRNRRAKADNDVRAAYWLQRAAAQADGEAAALLPSIAARATPAAWAVAALAHCSREVANTYPFLAARIRLAAVFGLSLPEALLLDLNAADRGHCLVVDIGSMHARSKRRLVLIESGEQRLELTRLARRFAQVDCGAHGPEGNYRQRQYLFRKLFPDAGPARKAMRKGTAMAACELLALSVTKTQRGTADCHSH